MSKINIYQSVALVLLAVSLFACAAPKTGTNLNGSGAADEQAANVSSKKASGNQPNENAGLCANEYYPLAATKKRSYKVSGSAPAGYVLTQNENQGNSFSEQRDFASGEKVTSNWVCTEEGLRNAEFSSGVQFAGGNFKLDTLEGSGITIPKKWENGKQWTAEYKINMKLNAGGMSREMGGSVKLINEIVSMNDKITTPAGDFEAAKVISETIINLSKGQPTTMKMTNWYAPNVGLVKQEVKSPFGGTQTVEYTGEK